MKLLWLFLIFAKISFFTYGGGYAMIPLFQDELVTKGRYLNEEQFANMVALAQVTPGPIGLNAATYIGYSQGGVPGSFMATGGLAFPSITVSVLAAVFMKKAKDNKYLKNALNGIRPAVLGLIGAAVFFFANTSVFTAPVNRLWTGQGGFGLSWQGSLIFCLALLLELKWKVNIIWVLLLSALLGYLLYLV